MSRRDRAAVQCKARVDKYLTDKYRAELKAQGTDPERCQKFTPHSSGYCWSHRRQR